MSTITDRVVRILFLYPERLTRSSDTQLRLPPRKVLQDVNGLL